MSGVWTMDFLNKFSRIRESHLQIFLPKYKHLLKWKSNESILDIGCGTGDLSRKYIYPLVPQDYSRYVCSDKSSVLIQSAKRQFEGKPRIFYEELDIAEDLRGKKENSFDHIFSLWCLMWVADQEKAFQNIYDLLLPGGECFHVFVAQHKMAEIIIDLATASKWKNFFPNAQEMYPFPYRRCVDPCKTIKEMMATIGYKNVKVYLEPSSFAFCSKEEFLGFYQAVPNSLHLMTTEEQKAFTMDAVELAFAKNMIIETGKSEQTGKILIIHAEKSK